METRTPSRGYAALRKFRQSRPESEYFLTINLRCRGRGLENTILTAQVMGGWTRLETEGWWHVRTATVMSDHVHLLVRLGQVSSLDQCLKAFKGRLQTALRCHDLHWQPGYYDHEVRSSEELKAIFLYIYLNSYRVNLLPDTGIWLGYWCRPEDWEWFGALTKESAPQPEWLR